MLSEGNRLRMRLSLAVAGAALMLTTTAFAAGPQITGVVVDNVHNTRGPPAQRDLPVRRGLLVRVFSRATLSQCPRRLLALARFRGSQTASDRSVKRRQARRQRCVSPNYPITVTRVTNYSDRLVGRGRHTHLLYRQ